MASLEHLAVLRSFLIASCDPAPVAPIVSSNVVDRSYSITNALLEQQLTREKSEHCQSLLAATDREQGLRTELERVKVLNTTLVLQAEEVPALRLRLAELSMQRGSVEAAMPPAPASIDALLQALKKNSVDAGALVSDCSGQLLKLAADVEAGRDEIGSLRSTCAASAASGLALAQTNAVLRQRLSVVLESQGAAAARAVAQGEVLSAAQARLAAARTEVGLLESQVADLSKKCAANDSTADTRASSLLMLHESRVTQEGALSRLRNESVKLRDRLRAHDDDTVATAASHTEQLRLRDLRAAEIASALREANEAFAAQARVTRASSEHVEALQLQLSEAELERSKLVVQLCEAEQQLRSSGGRGVTQDASAAPLALLAAVVGESSALPQSRLPAGNFDGYLGVEGVLAADGADDIALASAISIL